MNGIPPEALRQIAACDREPTDDESSALLLDTYESYKATFSSDIINSCSGKWVAAFHGRIVATADDLPTLAEKLIRNGIPNGFSAVRYVAP